MKMYIERASGDPVGLVKGFTIESADYQAQARPGGPFYTYPAWTVEITSLEELLKLATATQGVMLEWDPKHPPAPPIEHIPTVRIMDAEW